MGAIRHPERGRSRPPDRDRRVADLAVRQHGVVARWQLVGLGLGRSAIDHRLRKGRLHPIHPGVYTVGHALVEWRGRFTAAALACGPDAVISHLSAAVLWGLVSSSRTRVEVTTPTGSRGSRRGVIVHRARRLPSEDRAVVDGVPATSVARTLADMAETAPRRLDRAVEEAERRGLFDLQAIERVRGRLRGRHGLSALDAVIAEAGVPVLTRSELERCFLDLCRGFGVPPPAMNAVVEGFEVDAVWLDRRVVVEIDGHAFHKTRGAFERDRERDAALQVAGFRVVRVTERRLTGRSADVAATLTALLESGSQEGWQRGRMHRS